MKKILVILCCLGSISLLSACSSKSVKQDTANKSVNEKESDELVGAWENSNDKSEYHYFTSNGEKAIYYYDGLSYIFTVNQDDKTISTEDNSETVTLDYKNIGSKLLISSPTDGDLGVLTKLETKSNNSNVSLDGDWSMNYEGESLTLSVSGEDAILETTDEDDTTSASGTIDEENDAIKITGEEKYNFVIIEDTITFYDSKDPNIGFTLKRGLDKNFSDYDARYFEEEDLFFIYNDDFNKTFVVGEYFPEGNYRVYVNCNDLKDDETGKKAILDVVSEDGEKTTYDFKFDGFSSTEHQDIEFSNGDKLTLHSPDDSMDSHFTFDLN